MGSNLLSASDTVCVENYVSKSLYTKEISFLFNDLLSRIIKNTIFHSRFVLFDNSQSDILTLGL